MRPTYTAHLFVPLHAELIALLRSLTPEQWLRPTIAGRWCVRDVAAHLLDTTLRKVATYRDGHVLPLDAPIASAEDLTRLVNSLNAGGVAFARRLSTRQLADLLEMTGGWANALVELASSKAPAARPIATRIGFPPGGSAHVARARPCIV